MFSFVFFSLLMKVKVIQLCLALCNPMDYTVYGILQARILEWEAIPFSRRSSQSREWMQVSCTAGRFYTIWATREVGTFYVLCLVAQSCQTLCYPMDCSPPGSSVHGIFQARILEWVASSFSRRSSWPRDWTGVYGKIPWRKNRLLTPVLLGFPCGSTGKESACNAGDLGSIPGLGRSPGGGHDNPLQYSCL